MVRKNKNIKSIARIILVAVVALLAAGITGIGVNINIQPTNEGYNAEIEFSDEQIPATIEGDQGELIEDNEIPTVEEVDGGKFEDINTGLSTLEGDYEDLGANIETFDTSTPEAFKNATLGKCVYSSNKFGAQCVSLARSYWFSYAHRDVSTCGTGMAKGMMNCADQNAGNDFVVFWPSAYKTIQAGDWLVFTGGQYGHVGMALGPVVNGYVALLGENQGGAYCAGGGAATNIINISIKNLIGGYRPKAYIKPEPKPTPAPAPSQDKCKSRTVVKGDTMGKIMKECQGKITWGEAMNNYADHWHSTKLNKGHTVFYGWSHGTGYGLFYGDVIEYRAN